MFSIFFLSFYSQALSTIAKPAAKVDFRKCKPKLNLYTFRGIICLKPGVVEAKSVHAYFLYYIKISASTPLSTLPLSLPLFLFRLSYHVPYTILNTFQASQHLITHYALTLKKFRHHTFNIFSLLHCFVSARISHTSRHIQQRAAPYEEPLLLPSR